MRSSCSNLGRAVQKHIWIQIDGVSYTQLLRYVSEVLHTISKQTRWSPVEGTEEYRGGIAAFATRTCTGFGTGETCNLEG